MLRVNSVIRFCASLVAAGLLLGGCASYNPQNGAFDEALFAPYRLDSGDRLRVVVFGQTDISNTYTVDTAGYIAMPLIGTVVARGSTTQDLEQRIAAALRTNYIRNPDVTVEVSTYRPFFVMGEVGSAGQYAYVSGMTMQTAIAIAGGFSARANKSRVLVTRQFNGEIVHGEVPITYPVRPGDTIYVRERWF